MSIGVVVALIALIGSLTAATVSYVISSRKMSGKISSSEAQTIWDEARALSESYKDDGRELRKQLLEVSGRLSSAEGRIAEVERQNNNLVSENMSYESIIADLRSRLEKLEVENARLVELIGSLQEQLRQERGET